MPWPAKNATAMCGPNLLMDKTKLRASAEFFLRSCHPDFKLEAGDRRAASETKRSVLMCAYHCQKPRQPSQIGVSTQDQLQSSRASPRCERRPFHSHVLWLCGPITGLMSGRALAPGVLSQVHTSRTPTRTPSFVEKYDFIHLSRNVGRMLPPVDLRPAGRGDCRRDGDPSNQADR